MRRNAKYLVFANNGVACKIYSIGHGSVLKQIRLPTIGFAQHSAHPVSAALRGANCLTLGRTPRTGACGKVQAGQAGWTASPSPPQRR